ncbi:MAG: translation initiation factor IF-1 [Sandaracinaceae bacterium]
MRRKGGRRSGGRKKRRSFEDGVGEERDDHVKLDGTVTQVYAGGQFEVETDAGTTVRAQLCGRMRKFRIRVILGDRVTVALSPYDLTHGMIVYRMK